MRRSHGAVPLLVLSGAFAAFVQMAVVLTGRIPAPALTSALALGTLLVSGLAMPKPRDAVRDMSRREVWMACAGGILAIGCAPAVVAALRMSDAPAGSIVVFWMSAGWAAVMAAGAAMLALRRHRIMPAAWAFAGSLLALSGAAGVVADWERPSSFSPLVRFAPLEMGMLAGGVFLLAGMLLLARAAGTRRPDGAMLWGAASALACSLIWWTATGLDRGLRAIAEQPFEVGIAAVAWGLACTSLAVLVHGRRSAEAAAGLAVAPVLLSALVLVEQVVGVAGPQPLVVGGVMAGSLLLAAAVAGLVHADGSRPMRRSGALIAMAALPVVSAMVALVLPAITASAHVTVEGGVFAGTWSMIGAESVAGWAALALAVLVVAAAADRRPFVPVAAALLAAVGWSWLRNVPTHVWNSTLAPEIQQYYGTEYGTITFVAQRNVPMAAAVAIGAGVLLVIMTMRMRSARGAASHSQHGGS